jgi:hypothetical protein
VAVGVAALFAPALFFGIDDAISPDRLSHYPLSRRARVGGLAVASAIGAPALALALTLAGFVLGVTGRLVDLPLVALAAVGEFWLCVIGSRVPATLLARAVNSRRGRDVAAVLGAFVGFSGFLVQFLARRVNATSDTLRHIADVLRWTPWVRSVTPWSTSAMGVAADGRWAGHRHRRHRRAGVDVEHRPRPHARTDRQGRQR